MNGNNRFTGYQTAQEFLDEEEAQRVKDAQLIRLLRESKHYRRELTGKRLLRFLGWTVFWGAVIWVIVVMALAV